FASTKVRYWADKQRPFGCRPRQVTRPHLHNSSLRSSHKERRRILSNIGRDPIVKVLGEARKLGAIEMLPIIGVAKLPPNIFRSVPLKCKINWGEQIPSKRGRLT